MRRLHDVLITIEINMKKGSKKKGANPQDLSAIHSERLAKLLDTAVKAPERSPLRFNPSKAKYYQIYEFFLFPTDEYKELKPLFGNTFGEEQARLVFDELVDFFPFGVRLIQTSVLSSLVPCYESEYRIILLRLYLAAKLLCQEQFCSHPLVNVVSQQIDKSWTISSSILNVYVI